jgi:glycosyltransferase involved in cell wall biosynthesis
MNAMLKTKPVSRPDGSPLRVLVFGSQGVGMTPPIMAGLRGEFEVSCVPLLQMTKTLHFLLAARAVRFQREAWYRHWMHLREKTPFSFNYISKGARSYLADHQGTYDFIVQMGAMSSLGEVPKRPLFIVTDSTRALSSRNTVDTVSTFANEREKREWLALEGEFYRCATRIFVGSEFVRQSLVDDYNVPRERVIKTGFGAGTGYGAMLDKDFDGRSILYIGKGDFEKKGGHVLLAAFKIVRAAIPDVTLDIVGQDRLPETLDGVTNHGFVRDRPFLVELMRRAHVFTLPSLVDRNPITVLEAMSAGTPCVTSDYGAMPELLGDAGYAVRRDDPEALAESLIKVLKDRELAMTLGQRGRRRFEEHYNWEVIWPRMCAEMYIALGETFPGGVAPSWGPA